MKQVKKRSKSNKKQLCELYRPKSFDRVLGQDSAIKKIKMKLSRGWGGNAWWISGASGTGKTTLARIIANQSPQEPAVKEFDSANDVTVRVIRFIQKETRHAGFMPIIYIINEAHSLKKPVIQSLLGILEKLNQSQVIIFTTTKIGQEKLLDEKMDAKPLLSRCTTIELTNQGLARLFARRCMKIAKKEKLDGNKDITDYIALARKCNNNCRTMLMEIEAGCMLD